MNLSAGYLTDEFASILASNSETVLNSDTAGHSLSMSALPTASEVEGLALLGPRPHLKQFRDRLVRRHQRRTFFWTMTVTSRLPETRGGAQLQPRH
jgi:hypothetical protein